MLSIEDVSMTYPGAKDSGVHCLSNIDLDVGSHEFITIVGPSGCGKSTLLRLVAGLMMPTEGTISFERRMVTGPHRDVGLVFQQAVLLKWRTVLDNVLLPIEFLGQSRQEAIPDAMDLLKLVGLSGFEKKMPHQLSGGMQQRVSLARALIYDPRVLLMDEPFGALDALTREEMSVELLRIWQESRKSVLFVTHSISESIMLADRVIGMSPRPGRVLVDIPIGLPRPRRPEMQFSDEYIRCSKALHEVIYRGTDYKIND